VGNDLNDVADLDFVFTIRVSIREEQKLGPVLRAS
jgi:hypothetical protein